MRKVLKIFTILILSFSYARIWEVPPIPSIQVAIDYYAQPGDTISVWIRRPVPPDTYYENIDFRGKGIFVVNRSFLPGAVPYESSWHHVVINGERNPTSTVRMNISSSIPGVIKGFTINGGNANNGGGIYAVNNVRIIKNYINKNLASSKGGGIYVSLISQLPNTSIISDNLLSSNYADLGGGIGISTAHGEGSGVITIVKNSIISNEAGSRGAGIYGEIREPVAEDYQTTEIKIINNYIFNNKFYPRMGRGGGIYYCFFRLSGKEDSYLYIEIKKNVIVANSNYGCYFEATFFIPYPPELNPNLGTFQSPGLNAFISNEIGEVLNAIGGLNAVGNYWGSIHTSYVRNRIYNFFPSYTNFDPIAASDKYFSVTYPSYCSTDVIVTGDFTINSNASLNIKEGKTFYFTEKDDVAGGIASNLSELIIKGSINAYGNERDSIKFISYPYSEPIQLPIWYGIRVLENGRGNFTYCKIRGGFIGIYASSADLLNIQTSKITDNELAGVYCENTSPSISYCDFTNNGVYGIYLNSLVPVSPGIYHNNISLWHRYGIYWDAPPSLSAHITGNVIKGYSSFPYPSFYGIYLTCSYPPTSEMLKISNNKVENFFQAGLYFQGFSNAILKDTNRIKHNQPYGIHCVNNSSPIIRWSEIDSNFSMDVIGGGIFVEGNSYPDLGRENDKGMNIIDTFNPIYVANLNPIPQNPIYAQYNWWGCSPPDTSRFIGWVIYYPWLTSPPWEEKFSSSQVSNLNKINSPVLNISPNIIKDKLNIKYFLPKEEEVSLILYDNNGRKVKLIDKGKKDKNEITLLAKDLNNGLYFLILKGKDFNLKRKLIILK